MGLVYTEIEIINGQDIALQQTGHKRPEEVRRATIRVMVDSGAIMLAINETLQGQMGFPFRERRPAQLADGSSLDVDVVGPVEVRWGNRNSICSALVLPGDSEPLLGAIPIEEMDLIIDPAKNELTVHPMRPIRPMVSLK